MNRHRHHHQHFDSRDRHDLKLLEPGAQAAIRRVEHCISWLESQDDFYVFGGGRVGGPNPHMDLHSSGDCSWMGLGLCHVLGVDLKNPIGSTYSAAEEGEPGRGKYFTLLIKNIAGQPDESHMFVEVRGRHAECGGFDNPKPRGGPAWFKPSDQRLEEFPIHRHFPGL